MYPLNLADGIGPCGTHVTERDGPERDCALWQRYRSD